MLRLQYERIVHGLTQGQLARLANTQQPYVCLMERGRLVPTEEELAALARVLGISRPEVLLRPVIVEPVAPVSAEALP